MQTCTQRYEQHLEGCRRSSCADGHRFIIFPLWFSNLLQRPWCHPVLNRNPNKFRFNASTVRLPNADVIYCVNSTLRMSFQTKGFKVWLYQSRKMDKNLPEGNIEGFQPSDCDQVLITTGLRSLKEHGRGFLQTTCKGGLNPVDPVWTEPVLSCRTFCWTDVAWHKQQLLLWRLQVKQKESDQLIRDD